MPPSGSMRNLILCNLYKKLCIKLISIKELYYDARPTKSQDLHLQLLGCCTLPIVYSEQDIVSALGFVPVFRSTCGQKLIKLLRQERISSFIAHTTSQPIFQHQGYITQSNRVPQDKIYVDLLYLRNRFYNTEISIKYPNNLFFKFLNCSLSSTTLVLCPVD